MTEDEIWDADNIDNLDTITYNQSDGPLESHNLPYPDSPGSFDDDRKPPAL